LMMTMTLIVVSPQRARADARLCRMTRTGCGDHRL
jgi:hypothetical protein